MSDLHNKTNKSSTEIFYMKISNKEVHNTTVKNPYIIDPDSMPHDKSIDSLTMVERLFCDRW